MLLLLRICIYYIILMYFPGKLAKYFLVMSEVRALELYKIRNQNAKDINRNKMTAYKRSGPPVSSEIPKKR